MELEPKLINEGSATLQKYQQKTSKPFATSESQNNLHNPCSCCADFVLLDLPCHSSWPGWSPEQPGRDRYQIRVYTRGGSQQKIFFSCFIQRKILSKMLNFTKTLFVCIEQKSTLAVPLFPYIRKENVQKILFTNFVVAYLPPALKNSLSFLTFYKIIGMGFTNKYLLIWACKKCMLLFISENF